MAIEFSCEHCGKALSTTDDKAGRRAKCPQCGEVVVVPTPVDTMAADDDGLEPPPLGADAGVKNCPMCGEQVPASATKCGFCGEKLYTPATARVRESRKIEAGQVVSASWAIFKKEMGLVIGGVIVFNLLNFACGLPQNILNGVAAVLEAQGDRDSAMICRLIGAALLPFAFAGQMFFQIGLARFTLNIARGDSAQLGDLFTGAKFFWRMVGSTLLFGLMVGFGMLACIIPGIVLAIMFSPYAYLLVDRDPPGIECLTSARDVTKGNLGALFLIGLAAVGVNLLGLLAVCIGLIFTIPLTMLFFPVAYCHMTGQQTAE